MSLQQRQVFLAFHFDDLLTRQHLLHDLSEFVQVIESICMRVQVLLRRIFVGKQLLTLSGNICGLK
jgi:hypothetical protein